MIDVTKLTDRELDFLIEHEQAHLNIAKRYQTGEDNPLYTSTMVALWTAKHEKAKRRVAYNIACDRQIEKQLRAFVGHRPVPPNWVMSDLYGLPKKKKGKRK